MMGMVVANKMADFLSPPSSLPLILDLDGTVIRTDTFHEMMASLLMRKPLVLLYLPFWLLKGRAYAKARLVEDATINLENLPYNEQLLAFAQKERQKGRPLILATGTNQRLAQEISDYLGIFQDVIGSTKEVNMTGEQKRKALFDRFGLYGFDYAGDSPHDVSVWQVSRKALVISPKWGVLQKVHAMKTRENIYYIPREKRRVIAFCLVLRPLFWLFNLLASSFSLFIELGFLSSGLLIMGDLLNLEKERSNSQNRSTQKSIFAQGHLHLITAFLMVPCLVLPSLTSLFFVSGRVSYLGLYIPLFMGLDKLTRSLSLLPRWIILGIFQILFVLLID